MPKFMGDKRQPKVAAIQIVYDGDDAWVYNVNDTIRGAKRIASIEELHGTYTLYDKGGNKIMQIRNAPVIVYYEVPDEKI